jgi:hypothetical protein
MMARLRVGLFTLFAAGATLLAQTPARVVVPVLSMEDQFGTIHDVKQHRGEVLVLIYGDNGSIKANRDLGERLHVHYHPSAKGLPPAQAQKAPVKPVPGAPKEARSPNVRTVPIACFKTKMGEVAQSIARGMIRNGAPDVPVWLDFHSLMKTQFPFKESMPNVVVLDTQGRYRYAAAGQPTVEGVERLIAVIDQLRQEAVAAK